MADARVSGKGDPVAESTQPTAEPESNLDQVLRWRKEAKEVAGLRKENARLRRELGNALDVTRLLLRAIRPEDLSDVRLPDGGLEGDYIVGRIEARIDGSAEWAEKTG